jgi:hypothetical protein
MTALNQPHHTATAWTADDVRLRLVEAFKIERRMPGERRSKTSTWPASPIHTWQEAVHWHDARERVLDGWERAQPFPAEVTMMEEAIEWLRWLPLEERHALEAWAMAKARGLNKRRMMRGRWTVTTFYRLRDRGTERIAERLNRQGVQIRLP